MNDIAQVLRKLKARRITISNENGTLRYSAPAGIVTPRDLELLRVLKPQLLQFLTLNSPSTAATTTPLRPRRPAEPVPLTHTQRSRWAAFQVIGMSCNTRSVATAFRLTGPVCASSLTLACNATLQRHDALRTRIVVRSGVPVQEIDSAANCDLPVSDLRHLSSTALEKQTQRLVERTIDRPIDMTKDPLFSAELFRLSEDEHILVLAADHMIVDASSFRLLIRDLLHFYQADLAGEAPALPEVPVQFADFAIWQHKTLESWRLEHMEYWRGRLYGFETLRLPRDSLLDSAPAPAWADFPYVIPNSLRTRMSAFARQHRTTIPFILLAAYAAVLSSWCNESDLVIALMTEGRNLPELHNTIGFFASPLYLRLEVRSDDTFLGLLHRVISEYQDALSHHDGGYIAASWADRRILCCPTFNWTSLVSRGLPTQNGSSHNQPLPRMFPLRRRSPEMQSLLALPIYGGQPWLWLSDNSETIQGNVKYRPTQFSSSTIAELCAALHTFLVASLSDPLRYLSYPRTLKPPTIRHSGPRNF